LNGVLLPVWLHKCCATTGNTVQQRHHRCCQPCSIPANWGFSYSCGLAVLGHVYCRFCV